MQTSNDSLILGIDHGYGNIKTANKTFGTGVYQAIGKRSFCLYVLHIYLTMSNIDSIIYMSIFDI